MSKSIFRAAYGYDLAAASDECATRDFGPSLTVQSMAEDVDINVIMRRFGVTGKMPEDLRPLSYGDFSEVFDFRSAQNAILDARMRFDAMPAEVRSRFANDPQRFLEFCSVPGNQEELYRLGLAVKAKSPDPAVLASSPPDSGGAAVPAASAPSST